MIWSDVIVAHFEALSGTLPRQTEEYYKSPTQGRPTVGLDSSQIGVRISQTI